MRKIIAAVVLATTPQLGMSASFDFSVGDTPVSAVLNNTVTFGASWRIEDRADDLVGKSSLDPRVCSGVYQTCQGLHRDQTYPAEHLAAAPGMPSMNFDDGNLNYDKWDITQAPLKLSQDLNIRFGNFGFFFRGIGIYDDLNYRDFGSRYRNRITPENTLTTGNTGDPQVSNRYFDRVHGPGADVTLDRPEDEAQEIGLRFDLLDANFYGEVPLGEQRDLLFRIGRQTVNWGQSTVAVVNSVNQAQPVNVNSLHRLGFGLLEELFVPVGMARVSTDVIEGLSVEAYYQFEWAPVEIPTPGSYMSFVDVGTDNLRGSVNASFGGSADDPDQVGQQLDNPLSLLTPTSVNLDRLADNEARDQGQYGVSFKYYAEDLNNGTEFGLYFMNYHSKLPYVSFYSTDASCARAAGNAAGVDATNTLEFLDACPNLPLTRSLATVTQIGLDLTTLAVQRPGILGELGLGPNLGTALGALGNLLIRQPGVAESDMLALDSAKVQLEYPEDLKMYGFSFTTTAGELSFQGEVSYRPNVPLQVAILDLAFASFGPTLTSCHRASLGCSGATAGLGFDEAGDYVVYEGDNFTDADGNNPYPDMINMLVGSVPGSARSFPNFIIPYRGGTVGDNAPNSYIQGWIPGKVMQYNLGATQVLGASDNWIGADQVVLLYELAATHVLNLPDFDELQIEGPMSGATHASAGADGSGADGSKLACSTNPSCSVGPDGLRFNPTQAPRDAFADAFSWGYRVVGRINYESVLPGIGIQPLFIWQHDIGGNAPGPGGNFVEGRKTLNLLLELRLQTALSFTLSYNSFFGGGSNNLYRDRDNLGVFAKYLF
ncbi:DUF1302 domain-containing protein [Flagellatimonas centrodinii]|uniref:DUF1302 domain-containing protein n=1 Tax=Flagellatimonas centrodinii TaxID=2806210 RepID=UPI001FF74FEF|nr:DUF1302 family protein [Flagellatimonas centrodinii]ULQ47235.1 DUF1302 domain-containing protein [Flagellatimonas centrodinii]